MRVKLLAVSGGTKSGVWALVKSDAGGKIKYAIMSMMC